MMMKMLLGMMQARAHLAPTSHPPAPPPVPAPVTGAGAGTGTGAGPGVGIGPGTGTGIGTGTVCLPPLARESRRHRRISRPRSGSECVSAEAEAHTRLP